MWTKGVHHLRFYAVIYVLTMAGLANSSSGRERRPVAVSVSSGVELLCKLRPLAGGRYVRIWQIELRISSGETIRRELRLEGDKFRFRNLDPGIYVLSITDGRGRERSESVDLNPPPGRPNFQFQKELEAPGYSLSKKDTLRVSTRRLTVPQSARDARSKAEEYRLRGKIQEYFKHLNRALQLDPGFPEALNDMGLHYLRQGDQAQAIEFFRRSIESDPDNYPAWINLGSCLMAARRFENALEANRKAQELRPGEFLPNVQLALTYYYLRRYDEAEPYFRQSARQDPYNALGPQLFLAQIAMRNKNMGEAERYVRDFMELHPYAPRTAQLKRTLSYLRGERQESFEITETDSGP
jgi:Flp pilus assembly protein TadD